MNQNIVDALWITLIGMAIVFIALLLLWGLMAAMVNLGARWAKGSEEETEEAGGEALPEGESVMPALDASLRQKAAAAAVAVALARHSSHNGHSRLAQPQSTGAFSAWQSVLRGNQLNQQSRIYSRKQ